MYIISALSIVAALQSPLVVVDDAGNAVAGARVDFVDARGAHDVETTDEGGRAQPSAASAVGATISRRGFATLHVSLAGPRAGARVVLERVLPTIGSVAVATGSRSSLHQLPLPASLLDRETIALSPAISSDRLLRSLPGADRTRSNSAFTNYGQLRASFSGAGNDRGVVLVDGLPAQDAFGGQIDWQAYPPSEIERAELLRGAGSALYGSGAVGGVLDLQTFGPRSGVAVPVEGRLSLAAGNNASTDDALLVRAPLGNKLSASLAASATTFSYADLPPAYATPIDHAAIGQSALTHARLRYDDGATTLEGAGLFASDHQDEGRPNYTFDRTLRQESVVATHRLGDALASFTYYVRDTTVYNDSDFGPSNPGALRYRQHVPADENGFFASVTGAPGPVEYVLRIDQRRVDGRSEQTGPTGRFQALGTGTELLQGVALQATVRGSRYEVLAGVRGDRLRYDDLTLARSIPGPPPFVSTQTVAGHDEGAISPRVALRYDLTNGLALRVSSGGGFRGPYLNELVRGFNVGPVFDAPNPLLVPERSRTDSAGLDYLAGRGRLALDVVQTHVADAIAFVTVSPLKMMRTNVDRTQTNGETLTYSQPVGSCTRVRASGTTQYARVTAGPVGSVGKRLAFVPNRAATLGVDSAPSGPFAFSVEGAYVGQTYYDDLEQQPLGAALLFGATVRATSASGTSFALVADNLTSQRYLSNIDRYGPPATVSLRVTVPLGAAVTARSRAGCAPSFGS